MGLVGAGGSGKASRRRYPCSGHKASVGSSKQRSGQELLEKGGTKFRCAGCVSSGHLMHSDVAIVYKVICGLEICYQGRSEVFSRPTQKKEKKMVSMRGNRCVN